MTQPTIVNARTLQKFTLKAGDVHYFVPKPDTDLIEQYVCKQGSFGAEVWQEAGPLIDSKKAILDIGGNIGTAAVELAGVTSGNVHTFEPQRKTFYKLCTNITLSMRDNVYAHNFALGSLDQHDMETKIYTRHTGNNGMCTLEGSDMVDKPEDRAKMAYETVTVKCLDRFFNVGSDPDTSKISTVGFMKIDVEGFELQVLKGSVNLIKRDMPVIVFECAADSKTRVEIVKLLDSLGYNCSIMITGAHDWLAIPKTMDLQKFNEHRARYLRTLSVDARLTRCALNRNTKYWDVCSTLLDTIDPESKDITKAQRLRWYDESFSVLSWSGRTKEFHDIAYRFLRIIQTGIYDAEIKADPRLVGNYCFVKPLEYKETKEYHVDDYKSALVSIRKDMDPHIKHIIYAKNWKPNEGDHYWCIDHSNPQVKASV